MDVVIVGAGQAGFQCAASLREGGFPGRVTILGAEGALPYGRPPLSKAYLAGTADAEGLWLRPAAFFAERDIAVRTGVRVEALDRAAAAVVLAGGERVPYGHLVLATGARNRVLSAAGAELDGIFGLRDTADADRIKAALATARRVAVIGAGFIGLEFAAVAAKQGLDVTVLEATGRAMSRAVSSALATAVETAHAAAGIRFLFGAVVSAFAGEGGRVSGLSTLDGQEVAADLVVVGIGVLPNEELAAAAGLPVANGIVVDARLLTADPAISAVGDCAAHPSRFAGGTVRIESVQNAVDQGRAVAARLCGRPADYASVPWFWSDQGAMKIQMAGLPPPDGTDVVRGDPVSGAFAVFRFAGDRLACVETLNRPGDHMLARRLLESGISPTRAAAADPATNLKALLPGRRPASH